MDLTRHSAGGHPGWTRKRASQQALRGHFPPPHICRVASADHHIVSLPENIASPVSLVTLLAGVRAHETALSASRVLEDSKDGETQRWSYCRQSCEL